MQYRWTLQNKIIGGSFVDDFAKDIQENIDWLSSFGADPSGGITRLLYSSSWVEAQRGLKKKFEEVGLVSQFDSVGNLFGTVEGVELQDEIIMSGSHIDTVANGGNLDGQLGIIAGYICVKYLLEKYGKPKRTIRIASFAEEEGSRFPFTFWGSKNLFGMSNKSDVLEIKDANGISFVKAMKEAGFDYQEGDEQLHKNLKSFVELHIEQGNVLEINKQSVGIVTSIVGQRRYNIKLKGQSNHAGTTPMMYRKDTVYAFSQICYESIEKAKKVGDPLVITFGKVIPKPNTVNVVPGEVLFSIDCRHTDKQALLNFTTEIERDMENIAKIHGLEIEIELWMDESPVPMDLQLIDTLKEVCQTEKLNYRMMHSGAGHDSQILATRVPTVMVFVPSIGGISHNPAERTEINDIVQGVKALYAFLYEVAYK
jgi:allantoate deiminase